MSSPDRKVNGPPMARGPAADHRAKVRESLAKVDGGLLALADAARATFGEGVRLTGVEAVIDGEPLRMGRLSAFTAEEAREADAWLDQSPGDRAFGRRR